MNTMKRLMVALGMVIGLAAQAALYTYTWNSGFSGNGAIPDGNPAGWSDTRTLSGISDGIITDVNVRLEISGGYNGDLYGYLVHDSGFAVLLNRIGRTSTDAFGNSGAGMNVTLDDDSANDIHMAAYGVLGGTYNVDGRDINPTTVLDGDSRTADLADLTGNPNGSWTLFLADMAGGDASTLVSWGLDIEAVPEPVTWALIGFGTLVGGANLGRWARRRLSRV